MKFLKGRAHREIDEPEDATWRDAERYASGTRAMHRSAMAARVEGDPEPEDGPAWEDPFAARARLRSRPARGPVRRRIWDLEERQPGTPGPNDTGTEEQGQASATVQPEAVADDDTVAEARAQIARLEGRGIDRSAPTPPPGGTSSRAKTRVLGFHSHEPGASDPLSRAAASGAGPAFPVGWIVVAGGPGRGSSFTLHAGVSSIGRGEDQAVRLDFGDTSISRQTHASIAFDDETEQFFVGHGGKSNLVRLNGQPVVSTEVLKHGDQIRIGETTLRFVALCGEEFSWASAPETAPPSQAGGADAAAR